MGEKIDVLIHGKMERMSVPSIIHFLTVLTRADGQPVEMRHRDGEVVTFIVRTKE